MGNRAPKRTCLGNLLQGTVDVSNSDKQTALSKGVRKSFLKEVGLQRDFDTWVCGEQRGRYSYRGKYHEQKT